MKTSWEIIQQIYGIINVPAVNDAISGHIYAGQKPLNSEGQDISIAVTTNPEGFVQKPVANVNIYSPNINNRPDYLTLNNIGKTVMETLFQHRDNQGDLTFEVVDQDIMRDPDQPQMSFFNIRMNIQVL